MQIKIFMMTVMMVMTMITATTIKVYNGLRSDSIKIGHFYLKVTYFTYSVIESSLYHFYKHAENKLHVRRRNRFHKIYGTPQFQTSFC